MKIAHTWSSRIGIRNTSPHTATKSENFHEQNLQSSLAWKTLSFQLSSSFVWWCFFLPFSSFPRALFSFSIWTSWVEKEKDKWEECNAIECVVNGENGNAIFVHSSELFFPVKNYFLFSPLEQQLAAAPPFISHYSSRSLIAFSPSIISPFARYIWQCKLHNFLNFDKLQHYSAERAGTIELGRALWLEENARIICLSKLCSGVICEIFKFYLSSSVVKGKEAIFFFLSPLSTSWWTICVNKNRKTLDDDVVRSLSRFHYEISFFFRKMSGKYFDFPHAHQSSSRELFWQLGNRSRESKLFL